MTYLKAKISIQPAQKASIALLLAKKVNISKQYADFLDVFSKKSVSVLSKYSKINEHAIETFKTYIETNLANKFIRPFKYLVKVSIFFIWKPDGSLCLYVNYRNQNNLTIKNQYLLPLIGELLN